MQARIRSRPQAVPRLCLGNYSIRVSALSLAGEILCAPRMALRRPAAFAPIIDEAEAARHVLESLRPAHRRIGRMPEPGRRNRLEISTGNLVLIKFKHAFRGA